MHNARVLAWPLDGVVRVPADTFASGTVTFAPLDYAAVAPVPTSGSSSRATGYGGGLDVASLPSWSPAAASRGGVGAVPSTTTTGGPGGSVIPLQAAVDAARRRGGGALQPRPPPLVASSGSGGGAAAFFSDDDGGGGGGASSSGASAGTGMAGVDTAAAAPRTS